MVMKNIIILALMALVGYAYVKGTYDDLQAKAMRVVYEYRYDKEIVLRFIQAEGGN